MYGVDFWALDTDGQVNALAWARARRGPDMMGLTTTPLTGTEFVRLWNRIHGAKEGGDDPMGANAYLDGGGA